MNCFFGFLFCVLVPVITSAESLNGKPAATIIQSHKFKRFAGPMEEANSMSHLKFILEYNCLRELCNHVRYRKICRDLNYYQWLSLNHQKQAMQFNRRNGSPTSNDRIIPNRMLYVKPNVYFINKPVSFPFRKPSSLSRVSPNSFGRFNKNGLKEVHHLQSEDTEEKLKSESQIVQTNTIPKETPARNQTPHHQIHSYEVNEIIEEKPETNSPSFQNFYTDVKKTTEAPSTTQNSESLPQPLLKQIKSIHRPRVLVVKNNETKQSNQELLKSTPLPLKYSTLLETVEIPKKTPEHWEITTETGKTTTDTSLHNQSNPELIETQIPNVTNPTTAINKETTPAESEELLNIPNTTTNNMIWKKIQDFFNDAKFRDATDSTPTSVKSFEYFSQTTINEFDLTTPNFKEFTDEPFGFDLLAKIKSGLRKENDSKNSRKMHFEQTPWEAQDSEQRRSDILISDNNDYDYENTFLGSNYLEKLKQNSSLRNLTTEEIITLIPIVINDVREDKISPEDMLILSEAFGKYWTMVLSFSNSTTLDMLPLIKMKDENDLKTIWENFQAENFNPNEQLLKEFDNYGNFDYDLYEYLETKKKYNDMLQEETTEENSLSVKDATPEYSEGENY